ncbi:uncharacterized protein BO97DRAFT_253583 [Aspergillus homomorphus CBS 101889]|uniref:Uncharacterized protein n=1 Tax=Aspergillus homomorphus (strain CBS 101889) TaxID=1450537 RepID=A0A395HI97_ASPHC|nr:hypothetical protein BO97DRAFT_253583 [Aspergillus homomorphus CBS 101889]RAL07336.1 hypothetical protein BO97DRAFT_253583 [Aspergillus homomorphus CBS 101889]
MKDMMSGRSSSRTGSKNSRIVHQKIILMKSLAERKRSERQSGSGVVQSRPRKINFRIGEKHSTFNLVPNWRVIPDLVPDFSHAVCQSVSAATCQLLSGCPSALFFGLESCQTRSNNQAAEEQSQTRIKLYHSEGVNGVVTLSKCRCFGKSLACMQNAARFVVIYATLLEIEEAQQRKSKLSCCCRDSPRKQKNRSGVH